MVTIGHTRVTIGHPKVTIGHSIVTIGHPRVTIGYLRITICHPTQLSWLIFIPNQLKCEDNIRNYSI